MNEPVKMDRQLSPDYFRIRDFEFVQPLYDLAFLLEVNALATGAEVPKYRTFSLWRAGYSLDGYGTTIDRWLDGKMRDEDLDYVPSSRIREYLKSVRKSGTNPELKSFRGEQFARCLRLRSVRGLGPAQIALTISKRSLPDEWTDPAAVKLSLDIGRINQLYFGLNMGPWQVAHIIPPILRLLHCVEEVMGEQLEWAIEGVTNPFEPVRTEVKVLNRQPWERISKALVKALRKQKLFHQAPSKTAGAMNLRHQMGWGFVIVCTSSPIVSRDITTIALDLDPLASVSPLSLKSDLHVHTAWSDGNASIDKMASAIIASGLEFFAVTDHSRSSKLQGGLTPVLWIRQANAITLASTLSPVMHGIEVDILRDGQLDLPHALLAIADIVVASVHTSWSEDARENTDRLLRAIESGHIDILAHPTSAIVGKPGVPDYVRLPAAIYWEEVFESCALWRVAIEMNCFPSRLDLPLCMLKKAAEAGCAISFGSDAHARSHLAHLRFGEKALSYLDAPMVLNRLGHAELKKWLLQSRTERKKIPKKKAPLTQSELIFDLEKAPVAKLQASIQPPQRIPSGSDIIGIDLTAGNKETGIALLKEFHVETTSLITDEEILSYIREMRPKYVSIDSPLGLPGGGDVISPKAGIVRVAEYDLASVGIPAYPALIDSMEKLTLRGIRLRRAIEDFPDAPKVIESYPGAAQDILCIPRKQKSLELLREGLSRLGLTGPGLKTTSHDEMDAITSALVGRYFEAGEYEPMGIPSEAQLIVPKVRPLKFWSDPILCLAGKTGAGKSVVARYLSLFYGFEWLRTRDIIRQLLLKDIEKPRGERMFLGDVSPERITEKNLRDFGSLILTKYNQAPLRQGLTAIVQACRRPIVVDSVRDVVDLERGKLGNRPILTWYIDSDDSIIRKRLREKSKNGEVRSSRSGPIDSKISQMRQLANQTIFNSASLEELRWQIDDCLFAHLEFQSI